MKLFKLFTICAAVASSALFAEEAVENAIKVTGNIAL